MAYATWEPRPGRRTNLAYRTVVALYDPEAGEPYSYLPNVEVRSIQQREGAEPPTAAFRYVTDDRAAALGWPVHFEQLFRLAGAAPPAGGARPERAARYAVPPGSRLVVLGYDEEDDEGSILFDGFARAPAVSVDPRSQEVGFEADGVAVRLWDEPIHRIVLRDAGRPDDDSAGANRWTPLRARVNPDHKAAGLSIVTGNCTPEGHDVGSADEDTAFPVFVDSTYERAPDDPLRPRAWTLDLLARYLMGAHNGNGEFVSNPPFGTLDAVLNGRRPKEGREFFDPDDPDAYEDSPIVLPESDLTGRAWIESLHRLLVHHGFAMTFRTQEGGDGRPWTTIDVFRKDGTGPTAPKSVPYQEARAILDTNRTQVGSLQFARDFSQVFNAVIVDTTLTRYEVAVILAPAFVVAAADATASNALKFRAANLTDATPEMRDKYRLWVCEEVKGPTAARDGAGYKKGETTDLAFLDGFRIWPSDQDDRAAVERRRRRPGSSTLIARDSDGKVRKAELALSKDYAGPINALWDGTGTWQDVPWGYGWQLLKDRLGVRLTADDLEQWSIGKRTEGGTEIRSPVRLITATAAPDSRNPSLFLRLTTVIEGDARATKPIGRRKASPLKYERWRMVDARESFRVDVVHKSSPYFDEAVEEDGGRRIVGDGVVVRDDAERAEVYGRQVQQATEAAPVTGRIVIPWVTTAYEVGDQIAHVAGRGLDLGLTLGAEQGEGRRYPYVVGVDWRFGSDESTTLLISDKLASPAEEGATL